MVRLDWSAAQKLAPGSVLHRVELPAVTMTQLAFYCAAVRVTDPIHYDRDFALRSGFPDAVVNGSLRMAWLTQALADMIDAPDYIASLKCAHRAAMFVGQSIAFEVRTTAAAEAGDGGCLLPCEVLGRVGDKVIDHAEGVLFLGRRESSVLRAG